MIPPNFFVLRNNRCPAVRHHQYSTSKEKCKVRFLYTDIYEMIYLAHTFRFDSKQNRENKTKNFFNRHFSTNLYIVFDINDAPPRPHTNRQHHTRINAAPACQPTAPCSHQRRVCMPTDSTYPHRTAPALARQTAAHTRTAAPAPACQPVAP